jgi:hypothetical protein
VFRASIRGARRAAGAELRFVPLFLCFYVLNKPNARDDDDDDHDNVEEEEEEKEKERDKREEIV